jgi:hypothetical protein
VVIIHLEIKTNTIIKNNGFKEEMVEDKIQEVVAEVVEEIEEEDEEDTMIEEETVVGMNKESDMNEEEEDMIAVDSEVDIEVISVDDKTIILKNQKLRILTNKSISNHPSPRQLKNGNLKPIQSQPIIAHKLQLKVVGKKKRKSQELRKIKTTLMIKSKNHLTLIMESLRNQSFLVNKMISLR